MGAVCPGKRARICYMYGTAEAPTYNIRISRYRVSQARHRRNKNRLGNELPLELLRRVVKISGEWGGLLVDPFAGAGTSLVAARETGMEFLACYERLLGQGCGGSPGAHHGMSHAFDGPVVWFIICTRLSQLRMDVEQPMTTSASSISHNNQGHQPVRLMFTGVAKPVNKIVDAI